MLLVVAACASPSARPPRELSPAERAEDKRLETDREALAECGKLQAAAARAGRAPIFLATEVDQPAEMLPLPQQPGSRELPRRNATALVVVVVQETGRADRNSVRVVRASDLDFGAAVADLMRRGRYRPAMRAGGAVAQCLVLPWRMKLHG